MPKTSSSHSSKKLDRAIHTDKFKNHTSNKTKVIEEPKTMNPVISTSFDASSTSLKQKAMGKVKSILQQVLAPQNIKPLVETKKSTIPIENQSQPEEEKARHNLTKLIQLASIHPDYLKTEGVLRLITNHVEKKATLANMHNFFAKAETSISSVNLLTVLIKDQLKNALSQEQKKSIVLTMGVTANEFNKQNIAELRFHEINQELEKNIPIVQELPFALIEIINFSKKIVENQSVNKMPPSAIAFSLAPCLSPELKKSSEYLLTLLRFEIQINTLLKLAFKKWIIT